MPVTSHGSNTKNISAGFERMHKRTDTIVAKAHLAKVRLCCRGWFYAASADTA